MNKEDKIKELFAEKLGAHEAPVNPELWNAIASQLGTAATVTSTGLSIVTKIIIGVSAASVIGTGVYFMSGNSDSKQQKEAVQHSQLTEKIEEEQQTIDSKQMELTTNESSDQQKQDRGNVVAQSTDREDKKTEVQKQAEETTTSAAGKREDKSISRTHETTIPYRNESLPNLIGEKPAVVITETKAPVKTEERQTTRKQEEQVAERTASGQVQAEQKLTFEITKLPNIYVLNASGYFSIGHKGEYSDFQFTIMDNKNNVVFRSENPDFEWRGTDLYGNTIEPGNYIYIVTVKDQNGKAINKYSPLTVINQ